VDSEAIDDRAENARAHDANEYNQTTATTEAATLLLPERPRSADEKIEERKAHEQTATCVAVERGWNEAHKTTK